MAFAPAGGAPVDFAGATLVLPGLGLGNADQLAIDILIQTLALTGGIRHAGRFHSAHAAPTAGGNPFTGATPLHAAVGNIDVYEVVGHKVAILQQRAPSKELRHEQLVLDVVDWAQGAGFAKLLALSAADAGLRPERMRRGDRLVYVTTLDGGADPGVASGTGAVVYSPTLLADAEERAAAAESAARRAAAAAAAPAGGADAGTTAGALGPHAFASYYSGGGFADLDATGDGAASGSSGGAAGASSGSGAVPQWPGWRAVSPAAVASTRDLFSALWGTGYSPVYYRRVLSDKLQAATSTGTGGAAPKPLELTSLLLFAREGDNIGDAVTLAKAVCGACGIAPAAAAAPAAGAVAASPAAGAASAGAPAAAVAAGSDATGEASSSSSSPAPKKKAAGGGKKKGRKGDGVMRVEGFALPPYFARLFGPSVDVSAGSYGF